MIVVVVVFGVVSTSTGRSRAPIRTSLHRRGVRAVVVRSVNKHVFIDCSDTQENKARAETSICTYDFHNRVSDRRKRWVQTIPTPNINRISTILRRRRAIVSSTILVRRTVRAIIEISTSALFHIL